VEYERAVKGLRIRIETAWRRQWVRLAAVALAIPTVLLACAAGYYYISFARLIDARLQGARERVLPRVFGRPLELRRGQTLTERQLIDRLNDLGYAERAVLEKPGEFTRGAGLIAILSRAAAPDAPPVRVVFNKPTPAGRNRPLRAPDRIDRLEIGRERRERLTLDAPLLTSHIAGERERRRPVALDALPPTVVQAVLAIEDRRYYDHPGIDPIGMVRALVTNLFTDRAYRSGASTITQQVVRNVLLPQFEGWTLAAAREQTIRRKLLEQFVALVLNTRASKDEILETYLNDMPLGQRGSFAIFGFAEAARLFFGKDVQNVTLAEAATMAGVLQSPSALSPFNNPERCKERRNVVLRAMADAGFIDETLADTTTRQPLIVVQRALEAEAPYFVDYVARTLGEDYPGLTTSTNDAVDVYTTLDLHLQRLAQDAVRAGLLRVDEQLSRRRRKGLAEAALVAVDPRTGEVLAMVGGRSYNQSQYNRAVVARRQPGSVFKPFVFLSAFEAAADAGAADITAAALIDDAPASWDSNGELWSPQNYEQEYDGLITYRRALAMSRNLATIKVAERAGYDYVAGLWKKLGVGGTAPRPYPSIALGVFEASPLEIATAYTVFPNMGLVRPLRHIGRVERNARDITKKPATARDVTRPETTYLVTNMMRSVMNEGTGAGARANGFSLDAAGKTGTTNDLRDAWFVGFTPTLLTVVWVGFDDNQPVGLSGAQAALPIWTSFMTAALAGSPNQPFEPPQGMSFVDIDTDTGRLAAPGCPRVFREAFAPGTEPAQLCELHRF
jgi:penicillin-binding protein 1B